LNSWNWGSVADWVSGLGSFAAVITALYLAKKKQRIKLKGSCGIRAFGSHQNLLVIYVVNAGSRIAVISHIEMRVGRFRKRCALTSFFDDALSNESSISIEDSQPAYWQVPIDNKKEWVKDLVGDFVKSKSDAKSLRFVVYPTHGAPTVLKTEKSLITEIIAAIETKTI